MNSPIHNLQSVVSDTANLFNAKLEIVNHHKQVAGQFPGTYSKKVTKVSGKGRKGKIVYRYIYYKIV